MELFELVLILLGCVIGSAVLDQFVSRVSLPLIQIAVGLAAALVLPELAAVHVESELFLVLFIAPLLFNEAREAGKRELWDNKGAILSLAIGLVLATVLVVGFALHALVPSIPLAAAFALGAALGPTDAAAVAALGPSVNLTTRQKTLLSGESLINDASGVVCFQFAIAAALTGAFSAAEAAETFAVLFFGGIAAGAVMGAAARMSMVTLRRRGFENVTVHVVYEVVTPFVVFLAAEAVGTSGILAVVAAGFLMSERKSRLVSSDAARQQMVSESTWEVIIFLINGIIFSMLGMQLPRAFSPEVTAVVSPAALLGVVVFVTGLVMLCRFAWVSVMELRHVDGDGIRGSQHVGRTLREALVTTISGAKGAVTLSIIMTIPLVMADGATPFPSRSLIIFLAAGCILLSLVVADFALPKLAPKTDGGAEEEAALRQASIAVLSRTIEALEERVRDDRWPEYAPAINLAIARYRTRLIRERLEAEHCGQVTGELIREVLELQQARADEIQVQDGPEFDPRVAAPYFAMLRGIRMSLGYFGPGVTIGSRVTSLRGKLHLLKERFWPTQVHDERTERIYFDTCIFAIDLEHVAVDHLRGVAEQDPGRRGQVAAILADEHQAALNSLWGRINYRQDEPLQDTRVYEHGTHDKMPEQLQQNFREQFDRARQHADEVDAVALSMELDQIRIMQVNGEIDAAQAAELRERVYLLQMQLAE